MSRKKPALSKERAMDAMPVKAPVVKTERKNSKLYVTVRFERPTWQRALGAERYCNRTFGLDAYGEEVYEGCDGKTSVKEIVRRFSGKHHVSYAEAETSVAAFMKTLIAKGLVGMQISKTA